MSIVVNRPTRYEKAITIDKLPNIGEIIVPHNINTFSEIVSIQSCIVNSATNEIQNELDDSIVFAIDKDNLKVVTTKDYSNFSATVIIVYKKDK